uniref:Uncharacterized protein n=1 Tax=Pithovirus LCPAC101 TaxID=2506586 RepID=A0A481Z4G6_9VIRU|nr:MAG: hypothetical protein LCPAC101_02210 [Pithovirus LCPAC101]
MSAKVPPPTPKAVTDSVSDHNALRNTLKDLERAYGHAGRSSTVTLRGTRDGDVVIKASDLNDMHAALNRQVVNLGRNYAKAYKYNEKKVTKKDKGKKPINVNNGLIAAVQVDQPFVDFIDNGGDRALQQLTEVITKSKFGNRILLSAIIRRYVRQNNLVDDAGFNRTKLFGDTNKQFFKANKFMRDTFSEYFDDRRAKTSADLKEAGVRDGDMKVDEKKRNYFKKNKENKDFKPLANFNDYSSKRSNPDGLIPNYNDYHHAFDLDNLYLTAISSTLAAAGAVSNDALKLGKSEAAEYSRQLGEAGEFPDYDRASINTRTALKLTKNDPQLKILNLRALIDGTAQRVHKL